MNTEKKLTELPNIGIVLAKKLQSIGVMNESDLIQLGSENAIMKLATIESNEVCINMLYALEGAIQGIRWHNLSAARKDELKIFFQMLAKKLPNTLSACK